jgi:hypothetical protein
MMRGEILKVRAKPAERPAPGATRVLLRAAVPAVAGLVVIVAMTPASAAQRPSGPAAGRQAHASTAAATRARVAAGRPGYGTAEGSGCGVPVWWPWNSMAAIWVSLLVPNLNPALPSSPKLPMLYVMARV